MMAQAETSGSELDGRFWERRAQRADIMNTEPELRGRASYAELLKLVGMVIRFTQAGTDGAQ